MRLNPMCQAMKRQGACTADGCADWGDCDTPRTSKMPPNVRIEVELTEEHFHAMFGGPHSYSWINVTLLESEGIDHCEVIEEEL